MINYFTKDLPMLKRWKKGKKELVLTKHIFELPWKKVDLEKDISILKELEKELSPDHVLYEIHAKFIARSMENDDILLELLDGSNKFAVVHLSWIRRMEYKNEFPSTYFYNSFEEFSNSYERWKDEE